VRKPFGIACQEILDERPRPWRKAPGFGESAPAESGERYPIGAIVPVCYALAASGARTRPRATTTASPIRRMVTSIEDGWRESSRSELWMVRSVQRLPRRSLRRVSRRNAPRWCPSRWSVSPTASQCVAGSRARPPRKCGACSRNGPRPFGGRPNPYFVQECRDVLGDRAIHCWGVVATRQKQILELIGRNLQQFG
jgi:hypothetical protein